MSIETVTNKLSQANTIKGQIRDAIIAKDVPVPEGTPFSGYPALVQSITGHLQTKSITPDAAGQTATPDTGYDGFSSVTIPAEPDLIPSNIILGASIFGVDGTADAPSFDVNALLAGTLTTISSNADALRPYAFYRYTALQSATMQNLTVIGASAFHGCTGLTSVISGTVATVNDYAFYGCSSLATFDLSGVSEIKDSGLKNCYNLNAGTIKAVTIGQNACEYLACDTNNGFVYQPESTATVNSYGFQYSKISEINGTFSQIGVYAFGSCTSLTDINVKVMGSIGERAFDSNTNVSDFSFDSSSIVSSLGPGCFSDFGCSRENPESNVFTLDMRNSTFTSLAPYTFRRTKYMNVYLPETVSSVESCAISQSQHVNLYFTKTTPAILSDSFAASATNYKALVPYNSLNVYRTATNWSGITSNILGYAPAGTFAAGSSLPATNTEGISLTWYSDMSKTTIVNTVPADSPELYCDVAV